MILTKKHILDLVQHKKLAIKPFSSSQVGPASIDLTLDNTLRVFKQGNSISVKEGVDYKKITKKINFKKGYTLQPGELVLGITKEKINLPDNVCGWLNSRSRFARLGLMSHATAPFIAPGVNNKQVLEIYNAGPRPLKLKPGLKICHLILQKTEGKAKYKGRWRSQSL